MLSPVPTAPQWDWVWLSILIHTWMVFTLALSYFPTTYQCFLDHLPGKRLSPPVYFPGNVCFQETPNQSSALVQLIKRHLSGLQGLASNFSGPTKSDQGSDRQEIRGLDRSPPAPLLGISALPRHPTAAIDQPHHLLFLPSGSSKFPEEQLVYF